MAPFIEGTHVLVPWGSTDACDGICSHSHCISRPEGYPSARNSTPPAAKTIASAAAIQRVDMPHAPVASLPTSRQELPPKPKEREHHSLTTSCQELPPKPKERKHHRPLDKRTPKKASNGERPTPNSNSHSSDQCAQTRQHPRSNQHPSPRRMYAPSSTIDNHLMLLARSPRLGSTHHPDTAQPHTPASSNLEIISLLLRRQLPLPIAGLQAIRPLLTRGRILRIPLGAGHLRTHPTSRI